jgi:hypothetical protein
MGSSSNPPMFVITVNSTDASWFYCSEADHCQNGMVFAINPTVCPSTLKLMQSEQTVAQFMSAAGNAGASVSPTGGPTGGTMAAGSSSASMMSSTESSTSSSTEMSTMESSTPALTSSEIVAGTTSGAVSSPTKVSTSDSKVNVVSAVGLLTCFFGLFGIFRPVF